MTQNHFHYLLIIQMKQKVQNHFITNKIGLIVAWMGQHKEICSRSVLRTPDLTAITSGPTDWFCSFYCPKL